MLDKGRVGVTGVLSATDHADNVVVVAVKRYKPAPEWAVVPRLMNLRRIIEGTTVATGTGCGDR